jgi:WD40 repeat protein
MHGYVVWAVAFSPDGRTILTGSWDHSARLWDAATSAPRGAPLRHAGPVVSLAFSADNHSVLTASKDGTARLWDAHRGQPLGPPLRHDDEVSGALFDPQGRWLVTASHDRTVRLWEMPVPAEGSAEQVALWAQVLTGAELDPSGGMHVLDAATWNARRQRLQEVAPRLR